MLIETAAMRCVQTPNRMCGNSQSTIESVRRGCYPRHMVIGIIVFGSVFLVGLALGTVTRRPLTTASLVVAAFVSLLVVQTHEPLAGFAAFALISLAGLVLDSVRETVGLLLGR